MRTCDLRAEQSAYAIHDALMNHIDAENIHVMISDTLRAHTDLNRSEALDVEWRKKLRSLVRNGPDIIWVIDAHSFPQPTIHFGIDSKVVILNNTASQPEARLIYDHINNHSDLAENVRILRGSSLNDIQKEMSLYNLRSDQKIYNVLLEFNEDKEFLPDDELHDISAHIVDAIIYIASGSPGTHETCMLL
jgi:hypothetical protein